MGLGELNEKEHPERENMVKETLGEIEKELKSEINIVKIDRRVG